MTKMDHKNVRIPPSVPRIIVTRSTKISMRNKRNTRVMRTRRTIRAMDRRLDPCASSDGVAITISVHANKTRNVSNKCHPRPSPQRNLRQPFPEILMPNSTAKKVANTMSMRLQPTQSLCMSVLMPKTAVFKRITEEDMSSAMMFDRCFNHPQHERRRFLPLPSYTSEREASTTCERYAPFSLSLPPAVERLTSFRTTSGNSSPWASELSLSSGGAARASSGRSSRPSAPQLGWGACSPGSARGPEIRTCFSDAGKSFGAGTVRLGLILPKWGDSPHMVFNRRGDG
mmetsp:Transcript_31480/g.92110  ORF Transcript_31480/g.92110 Transcript_31480/m.92110 type:complete len:286 (-) Transcript_31480:371-1228(-)